MTARTLAAALLCGLAFSTASAQTVYRCGNSYSRVPCAGDARIVDASDARTGAQRAEARQTVADEKRLAADMRRERLEDQRGLKPAGASSLSGVPAAKAASAPPRGAPKKHKRTTAHTAAGDDFVAIDPTHRSRRAGR